MISQIYPLTIFSVVTIENTSPNVALARSLTPFVVMFIYLGLVIVGMMTMTS